MKATPVICGDHLVLISECDCLNLDQDVSGYTCYKCYERGE